MTEQGPARLLTQAGRGASQTPNCPKKGQVLCAPKHAEVIITVALIQECHSGQEGTEPWGCPDPPDRWLGIRELALCCCRYLGYLCTDHQGPRAGAQSHSSAHRLGELSSCKSETFPRNQRRAESRKQPHLGTKRALPREFGSRATCCLSDPFLEIQRLSRDTVTGSQSLVNLCFQYYSALSCTLPKSPFGRVYSRRIQSQNRNGAAPFPCWPHSTQEETVPVPVT